jgi:uncharacterized iron-regulated protein
MLAFAPAFAQGCVRVGAWALPAAAGAAEITVREVLERARAHRVVLLGESHERAEDHRWQLQTMAALHAQKSEMVLGFEMFPRRVQPVLDRWVAGQLSEAQFLDESDWARVWGFEAAHYLPLFHFARMNRIPMIALNVERSLIREIGRKGAEAVPTSLREGVGRPDAAPEAYLEELHAVYLQHGEKRSAGKDDPGFLRFVEGQLTWDRAMAEAIRAAGERHPGHQVVAILGRGHTGPGAVPHQLRALGIAHSMVLLPWQSDADCNPLKPGVADAVFGVEAPRASDGRRARPTLGVSLAADATAGVRIEGVSDGSIAAAAGLRAGDFFVQLAGRPVKRSADVVAAISRQAPGTWLPMRVRRDGAEMELVAKFPAE